MEYGNLITSIFMIFLVVLLVKPQLLKFLKKPTRWKAVGIWFAVFCIVINIYTQTPIGKAEFADMQAKRQLQNQPAGITLYGWNLDSLTEEQRIFVVNEINKSYYDATYIPDALQPTRKTRWMGPIKVTDHRDTTNSK